MNYIKSFSIYTHIDICTYDPPFATLPHKPHKPIDATSNIRHFYSIIFSNIFIFSPLALFYVASTCLYVYVLVYAFKLLLNFFAQNKRAFYLLLLFFIFFFAFFACFMYITLFCATWRTIATINTEGRSKTKKRNTELNITRAHAYTHTPV